MTEALAKDAPSAACAEDPFIAALVDRAVATRDHVAFGMIFDRFGQQIYRYMCVRREDPADAEDLTQQVFLNAWEAIGSFRWQGRPFVAWLYRLAHNAYIDHVRRQRPAVSLEHAISLGQQVSTTSSGDVTSLLDADVLAAAVRQLTPKQQRAIQLRFIADLATCDIAKIMGEREGAIRALQMRALMRLRRVLDRQASVESPVVVGQTASGRQAAQGQRSGARRTSGARAQRRAGVRSDPTVLGDNHAGVRDRWQVGHRRVFWVSRGSAPQSRAAGRQIGPGRPSTQPAPAGVSSRFEARALAPTAKVPDAPSTPVEAAAAVRARLRGAAAGEAAPTAATPSTGPGGSRARARLRVGVTRLHRFRIRFLAERVVKARDIRDAVHQAKSIRAVEVTAVMRED